MKFRFTLISDDGSQEIAEPGGWQDHQLVRERHPQFHTLIESVNVDKLIFVGNDHEDGDGGMDFIKEAEQNYGVNAKVELLVEIAPDDLNYEDYFRGLLSLDGLRELPGELEVPIIRNDAWSKFINRFDTPVDVTSSVDLDGNAVTPLEPVTVHLTSQVVRKLFDGHLLDTRTIDETEISINHYIQLDVDHYVVEEIEEKFTLPIINNPDVPAWLFGLEDDAEYAFDLRVEMSIIYYQAGGVYPDCSVDRNIIGSGSYINVYFQINNEAPIAFDKADTPLILENIATVYTYSGSRELKKGDQIRIYAKLESSIAGLGESATIWVHSVNGVGSVYVPQGIIDVGTETCQLFRPDEPENITIAAPSGEEFPTYFRITADTTYPDTEAPGFWLHDLFYAVLVRIAPEYKGIYSEILGGTFTNARQYGSNGCFSNFVILKGIHIRGYSLAEDEDDPAQRYTLDQKPFTVSFKDLWEGANPIFNLALGEETVSNERVIEIERKRDTTPNTTASINFDEVEPYREYDKDLLFRKISVGYNKWEAESYASIDDPQTRRVYSTPLSRGGNDLMLSSSFIAASIAIETTRRMTIEHSSDYRYDNDNFIIAMNIDDAPVSPAIYYPELDENFTSVDNLLHSNTRYNLILTPLRNLLRWGDIITAGLQSNLAQSIKFQSGEGNFDMVSDYDCAAGQTCQAIICDEIGEGEDISLADYADDISYSHLALTGNVDVPMSWEEYKQIRDNPTKPIGISQTDTGHIRFYIKRLSYDPFAGQAQITAWARQYFDIQIIDQELEGDCVPPEPEPEGLQTEYQAILDYATSQGYTLPSLEQQALQNQLVKNLKQAGIWSELDVLYVFATDGDEDFACINWISPGDFTCTRHDNPVFTSNEGFKGDGVGAYLDTGWAPDTHGVKYTQANAGAFTYISNDEESNSGSALGSVTFAGQLRLTPRHSTTGTCTYSINGSALGAGDNEDTVGLYHWFVTSSLTARIYKDGSAMNINPSAHGTGVPDLSVRMFTHNASEGIGTGFTSWGIGVFGAGAAMDGREFDLYTAWNTYFSSL